MPRRAYPILTQLTVDKTKPRGGRYEIPDGPGGVPGFALRVGTTGGKSYVVRVRARGIQRRVLIGKAAVLDLAEARARARKIVDQAREGMDPAPKAQPRRETVAAAAEEYLARHVRRNLRSSVATERRLKRDVVAAWGDRPVDSITRRDVVALVDAIADKAPVSANRTLQLVHRFFRWCVKRSILEANAAAGIDLPHKEHGRDRTLTDGELAAAWGAFEAMGWPWGDFGRLLVLTGARRAEWAEARWSELDLEHALWTLPPARSKSGKGHVLPLTPLMIEILTAMPRVDGEELLFPSRRRGRPIRSFSKALPWVHEASGTSGWSWHDLRRTFRTGLARLGVQPHVAERVIGHAFGSKVERTYDRHRYLPEVRQALLLWQAELERIIGGGAPKVEPLRRAG
jgi:integrase